MILLLFLFYYWLISFILSTSNKIYDIISFNLFGFEKNIMRAKNQNRQHVKSNFPLFLLCPVMEDVTERLELQEIPATSGRRKISASQNFSVADLMQKSYFLTGQSYKLGVVVWFWGKIPKKTCLNFWKKRQILLYKNFLKILEIKQ